MTWKKVAKALLFCSGMAASVVTGHLFYIERYPSGLALFALTALFLFYAMADPESTAAKRRAMEENFLPSDDADFKSAVGQLAQFVAESAVVNAKNIGRTLPLTLTEISRLEDVLLPVLTEFNVPAGDKNRVVEECDKLRARARQTEGRRALSGRF